MPPSGMITMSIVADSGAKEDPFNNKTLQIWEQRRAKIPFIKQIFVAFSQFYVTTNDTTPHRPYYNPSVLYNPSPFIVGPQEELVVIVTASGFDLVEEEISFAWLEQKKNQLIVDYRKTKREQIGLILKPKIPNLLISVGPRTNLEFLLSTCAFHIIQIHMSAEDGFACLQNQRERDASDIIAAAAAEEEVRNRKSPLTLDQRIAQMQNEQRPLPTFIDPPYNMSESENLPEFFTGVPSSFDFEEEEVENENI
jgi:hypothetical protein